MTIGLLTLSTLRRASRERIHLVSILIMVLLVLGLNTIESAEAGRRTKLILDFGTILLDFFSFLLALLVGQSFILGEFSSKQAHLWLYRPVSRFSFLVSKWLAGSILVTVNLTLITVAMGLALSRAGDVAAGDLLRALCLMSFKVALFMAAITTLGVFMTPVVAIFAGVMLWVFCHMTLFLKKVFVTGIGPLDSALAAALEILPDFSHFDVSFVLIHGHTIPWSYVGTMGLFAFAHAAVLLTVAGLIYERRDL